jgi:hypothetical protein
MALVIVGKVKSPGICSPIALAICRYLGKNYSNGKVVYTPITAAGYGGQRLGVDPIEFRTKEPMQFWVDNIVNIAMREEGNHINKEIDQLCIKSPVDEKILVTPPLPIVNINNMLEQGRIFWNLVKESETVFVLDFDEYSTVVSSGVVATIMISNVSIISVPDRENAIIDTYQFFKQLINMALFGSTDFGKRIFVRHFTGKKPNFKNVDSLLIESKVINLDKAVSVADKVFDINYNQIAEISEKSSYDASDLDKLEKEMMPIVKEVLSVISN